jgi:hypothetical protein
MYIGSATYTNGCISRDTIVVTHKPTPVVNLKGREIVCEGQNNLFEVSTPHSTYLWQDGTTTPSVVVSQPGKYWVTVSNDEGCIDTDTVFVKAIASLPSDFIVSDTVICHSGFLKLAPHFAYNSYSWSTGSTAPSVTIQKPGEIQLTVIDSNGCLGGQLITIREMKCANTVAFPNVHPGQRWPKRHLQTNSARSVEQLQAPGI